MAKFVRTFGQISKEDVQDVGGKAANLGELTLKGFNVPQGFCVTTASLSHLISYNGLESEIEGIVARFDYDDFGAMDEATEVIRGLICKADIPGDLRGEISAAIKEIQGEGAGFVAVRSSVAVKGSEISSFPGMMDTFHYLKGEEEILEHIQRCWASLWTTRATLNRHHKSIDQSLGLIAPVVQKMLFPETAGVLFTANPITSSRDEIVIEANWGLGESVVSGRSMNDFYLLCKEPLSLKQKNILKKTVMIDFDGEKGSGRRDRAVAPDMMDKATLTDDQALTLGGKGIEIEAAFGHPQDIEWACQKGEFFILQTRNIRTLK